MYVFYGNWLFSLVAMATQSFQRLIMGKTEKWHLLQSHRRYFDKTFIEMFLEKSCFSHIFLAHCLFVLVAIETIMQKKKMEKANT